MFKSIRNKVLRAAGSVALAATAAVTLAGRSFAAPYDLTTQTTAATDGGTGLVNAAQSSFSTMWPVIVGLIAAVFLAFWVINRVKKGAAGAK